MIVKFRSMKNKQYYFHVKARNNRIIAQSEGYRTRASRDMGVRSLIRIMASPVKIKNRGLTRRYDA